MWMYVKHGDVQDEKVSACDLVQIYIAVRKVELLHGSVLQLSQHVAPCPGPGSSLSGETKPLKREWRLVGQAVCASSVPRNPFHEAPDLIIREDATSVDTEVQHSPQLFRTGVDECLSPVRTDA